jgi:ribosomal protein S3
MRIVTRDERVLEGTPLQIVRAMKGMAFGVEGLTMRQYIEWVVANAERFEGVVLKVEGGTDEELVASLVAQMIRTGLARRG